MKSSVFICLNRDSLDDLILDQFLVDRRRLWRMIKCGERRLDWRQWLHLSNDHWMLVTWDNVEHWLRMYIINSVQDRVRKNNIRNIIMLKYNIRNMITSSIYNMVRYSRNRSEVLLNTLVKSWQLVILMIL